MKIDISDETIDRIMADVMVQDYYRLESDINRYRERTILSDIEKADLKSWELTIQALDVVLDYYIGYEWKKRHVG